MGINILKIALLLFFIQISHSIIISTSFGKLDGKRIGDYHLFKNIPFAKPPIGKLRFQKPEDVEKWNGVRNATEYGPACMSNSTYTKSPQKWVDEDCLQLNIFTSDKCLKSKDCSVVVYIHGGDTFFDSAVMFNDTFVLDSFVKQDVILVIPAFRLGIFSHFIVQDQSIAPNNLPLYDILKALEYVKSEINKFGGCNKNVTLFGHSYGGTITSMLTFSTHINKDLSLFQQTVSISAHLYFEKLEFQIEKARQFAESANCVVPPKLEKKMTRNQQDSYTMQCLQEKSAMELLRIQRKLEEEGAPNLGGIVLREPLFPEVKPMEIMDNPKMIPMFTGCTKIEFDHEPEVIRLAETFGFDNPDECDVKYRADVKEGRFDRDNHTDKTQAILVPTKIRVDKLLKKQVPVYLYEYTYPKHAKHTDDLYFIMGVHPFEKDENEVHLEKVYQKMFINFVKFGYPGDGFELTNSKDSLYYEVYWNETTGERPKMRKNFEKKINDYWLKEMMEYDRSVTAEKKRNSLKNPDLRYSNLIIDQPDWVQSSDIFIGILMVSLIFLAGCFAGRCCLGSRDRHLYIRLDGGNFESAKQY